MRRLDPAAEAPTLSMTFSVSVLHWNSSASQSILCAVHRSQNSTSPHLKNSSTDTNAVSVAHTGSWIRYSLAGGRVDIAAVKYGLLSCSSGSGTESSRLSMWKTAVRSAITYLQHFVVFLAQARLFVQAPFQPLH